MWEHDGSLAERTPKHLRTWDARQLWLEDLRDLPAPILGHAPVLQIRVAPQMARRLGAGDHPHVAEAIRDRGRATEFFECWHRTVVLQAAGTFVLVPDRFIHVDGPVSRGLRGSGRLESGDALAFEALDHEDGWVPEAFDWQSNADRLEASMRRLLAALWLFPIEAAHPVVLTARITAVGARLVMEHSRYACSRQVRLPSTRIARTKPIALPHGASVANSDELAKRIITALHLRREPAHGTHAAEPNATPFPSLDWLRASIAASRLV